MSFAGNLEHLPIVDVIQLLHSTRKTGTLYLKSDLGESQLVFVDGFIVSANHVNNSIRIGQILLNMGLITNEYLEQSLNIQKNAGTNRKPLIATLIEGNYLKKEDAYKGLEALIEMSVVEILTWTKGIFRLDVKTTTVSDEYRYLPEILKHEINLNTQNVLMDALRIYDEKMRNGTLEGGVFTLLDQPQENVFGAEQKTGITADVLGLDGIETIEKKIPDVYSGLRDYEFSDYTPNSLQDDLPVIDLAEQNKIYSYLTEFSESSKVQADKFQSSIRNNGIIYFGQDQFLNRIITTTCKYEGLQVSTCLDEASLYRNIDIAIDKSITPLIIIDAPVSFAETFTEEKVLRITSLLRDKYLHQIKVMQLFGITDIQLPMHSLLSGANSIIPRPATDGQQIVFTEETINFLKILQKHLQATFLNTSNLLMAHFRECMTELTTVREAPKLAYIPLKFSYLMFERAITFFVGKSELIAKNEIGITGHRLAGTHPPMSLRIPLDQPSVFQDVVQQGNSFYGENDNIILKNLIFNEIGTPQDNIFSLTPITSFGKVAAVIYNDFGTKDAKPVQIELLNVIAKTAGLALDNCLYRKQLVKQKKPL